MRSVFVRSARIMKQMLSASVAQKVTFFATNARLTTGKNWLHPRTTSENFKLRHYRLLDNLMDRFFLSPLIQFSRWQWISLKRYQVIFRHHAATVAGTR